MDIINELLESTRAGNRAGAALSLETWRDTYGDESLLESVLKPFLNYVREEWGRGGLSLAQAYVATKIAEDALNVKTVSLAKAGAPSIRLKGPVVIGNAEGDFHGLGRKMVGLYLKADLAKVRPMVGNGIALVGGINVPTLDRPTPEEIYRCCAAILDDRRDDPGFMPRTDIPFNTSSENIRAMTQTANSVRR